MKMVHKKGIDDMMDNKGKKAKGKKGKAKGKKKKG